MPSSASPSKNPRLGIPLLLGLDVIHGHRTIFPVPLAEACLFAPDLWEKTARAAAEEATQDGVALTFAPMLDVARDPRWGRIVEGPGEDPWVASQIAAAKTRGFQGQDLAAADSLAATAKHFLRLWRRHRRARIRLGRRVRENAARDLPPAVFRRRRRGDGGGHAGLHRYCRRADDRQRSAAARLAAGRTWFRGRVDQRLQRRRGTLEPWRGGEMPPRPPLWPSKPASTSI